MDTLKTRAAPARVKPKVESAQPQDVNVDVIPGWVSEVEHTFQTPGDYLLICNQYCGAGHAGMFSCLIGMFGISARGETSFAFAQAANTEESPWWLDRIDIWAAACIAMVVIAYAGPVWQHFHEGTIYLAPGMRTW